MFGPTRRLALLLMWLALALLPLRGWANGCLPMRGSAAPVAAAMPCHADESSASQPGGEAAAADAQAACTLCQFCHAGAPLLAQPPAAESLLATPQVAAQAPTPGDAEWPGPERPPRA